MASTALPNGAHLRMVLDSVWQCRANCAALAASLLDELDRDSWIVIAAWDTGASFGPIFGRLHVDSQGSIVIGDAWHRSLLRANLYQAQAHDDMPPLLSLKGTAYGVVVDEDSPSFPRESVTHDPVSLVIALELIRDHVDSALLLPRDLRNSEIARMADAADITELHFRRLAAWYPQIERYALEVGYSASSRE